MFSFSKRERWSLCGVSFFISVRMEVKLVGERIEEVVILWSLNWERVYIGDVEKRFLKSFSWIPYSSMFDKISFKDLAFLGS